jgi:hypothetical protein
MADEGKVTEIESATISRFVIIITNGQITHLLRSKQSSQEPVATESKTNGETVITQSEEVAKAQGSPKEELHTDGSREQAEAVDGPKTVTKANDETRHRGVEVIINAARTKSLSIKGLESPSVDSEDPSSE